LTPISVVYLQGIFVTKILPGGPASSCLKLGDKLLEVNSTVVSLIYKSTDSYCTNKIYVQQIIPAHSLFSVIISMNYSLVHTQESV